MGKRRHSYWAVYADTKQVATPRGPKGFVETTAAFISSPQTGVGRDVCIMREQAGGTGPTETGVCYLGGQRKKKRRRGGLAGAPPATGGQ